ncbi:MAG: hypothetical protein JW941_11475, partial [Candidatus Coatesbacteria bacterium]|nr:hypothetical protein [Candidatus Coatesbacteria bacterium]
MKAKYANLSHALFVTVVLIAAIISPPAILAEEAQSVDCLVMRDHDGLLPDLIDDDSLIAIDYGAFVLISARPDLVEDLVASGVSVEDLSSKRLIRLGDYVFDPVDGPGFLPAHLRL